MRDRHTNAGQAMLEFALVLPFIVLIVVLFIEFGRVVYYYSALNNAVREGARFAIVEQFASSGERLTEVQQRVTGYAIWLPISSGDVTLYCDMDTGDTDNPCEDFVTVQASTEIEPIAAFVALLFGAGTSYDITAQSTMQMTPFGRLVAVP